MKVFIYGNGDFAKLVKEYFDWSGKYKVEGFIVDREYLKAPSFCGLPVYSLEECEDRFPRSQFGCFVAIGYKNMNRIRGEKILLMKEKGYELVSYIDSSSRIAPNVQIGDNCFIMENAVCQPGASIGDGVLVGTGTCVGHDVTVQKNCFISAGVIIGGFVKVGENSFVGINASIKDGLDIADFTLVGASAYIAKNTKTFGAYLVEHTRDILKKVECRKEIQSNLL